MNEEQLQAIEARAAAATPGPWEIRRDELDEDFDDEEQALAYPSTIGPISFWEHEALDADGRDGAPQIEADAAFVAAARSDVPALVAAVRDANARAAKAEAIARAERGARKAEEEVWLGAIGQFDSATMERLRAKRRAAWDVLTAAGGEP